MTDARALHIFAIPSFFIGLPCRSPKSTYPHLRVCPPRGQNTAGMYIRTQHWIILTSLTSMPCNLWCCYFHRAGGRCRQESWCASFRFLYPRRGGEREITIHFLTLLVTLVYDTLSDAILKTSSEP
jgi:hypothetical protein